MAVAGIDETRLRRAFLEEAEDLSQKLGDSLLGLETEHQNGNLINEVFRLTHSLKSESALMGFKTLSELAHRMEDVLGLAREGRRQLDKGTMDSLFAGADLIAEMMGAIGKGSSDSAFDTAAVLAGLSSIVSGSSGSAATQSRSAERSEVTAAAAAQSSAALAAQSSAAPAAQSGPGRQAPARPALSFSDFERHQLAEARDRGETAYRLTVNVDPEESMKFPRAYLVFYNLELVANVIQAAPPMEGEMADDALYAHTTILLTTGGGEPALGSAASVDQIASVQIERCDYAALLAPSAGTAPVGTAASRPQAAADSLQSRAEPLPAVQPPAEEPSRAAAPVERTSIRVDTRKLDDLWSFIAELVLHKSQISRLSESLGKGADVNTVREDLSESFDALDKISSGMQQAMMDTRMIPISIIFSKFPRLVRDLSRKLGKPIELSLSGEDTEIDRSVVEALSDPLTHIIRNSLDHGIEFPEERVRLGKSEKGYVHVEARRQGGNVVIELSDDGRGMDAEQIRRKALGMGIRAESFTVSQLLELVFLPGFSTKEVVTDVSGRGVGMDVVATRVRGDLKGDVVLATEPGKGTRVTLVLPLTLTIVNALLVRGDNQLYAIPLIDVDSTAKLLAVEIAGGEGRETSLWRDEEIPVYSLGAFFGTGRRRQDEYFALVLHHGDARAYLIVDELIEEREVVIKPVDDLLNSTRLFSGVALLEDGRLVFILDTSFVRRGNF
jgi:two-component system, chemotaxis family, sensor kinase CheA